MEEILNKHFRQPGGSWEYKGRAIFHSDYRNDFAILIMGDRGLHWFRLYSSVFSLRLNIL